MEYEMETVFGVGNIPALLTLNDDVLLQIIMLLKLEDAINLSECCIRLKFLAQLSYTKYKTFKTTAEECRTDRIFSHIGSNILSLEIDATSPCDNFSCTYIDLTNIIPLCNNLKKLVISRWKDNGDIETNDIGELPNFEQLTLFDCVFTPGNSFLRSVRRLKYLNVSCCTGIDFNTILKNNSEIETFTFYANDDDLPDLEHLLKLERICFCLNDMTNFELSQHLSSLLRLDVLTKLKLCCKDNLLKPFLIELAKKGTLEELEVDIYVDERFFKTLNSFKKLQLLIINANDKYQLKPTFNWPANLKALKLTDFEITYNGLASAIQQLENLQCIELVYCSVADWDVLNFSDAMQVGQQILKLLERRDRQYKLDVILPWSLRLRGNHVMNYSFYTDRLSVITSSVSLKSMQPFQKYYPGLKFYN